MAIYKMCTSQIELKFSKEQCDLFKDKCVKNATICSDLKEILVEFIKTRL